MVNTMISNKQADEAAERGEAINQHAIANRFNNDPEYVAGRFFQLFGGQCAEIRVRPGALTPMPLKLVSDDRSPAKMGKSRSARPLSGRIATLLDVATGQYSDFRINSDGANGVEVVGRA